ncbi:MAG: glycosyltransferase, partial [candidate division KSB1 bacterium]
DPGTGRRLPEVVDDRQRVRREWQVRDDEVLIGLVARLDPMKDHSTFLHAAAILARERRSVRFICIGDGPQEYLRALQALASELQLQACLIWSNGREDMPAVYNALDLLASSSAYGEGFSNVI